MRRVSVVIALVLLASAAAGCARSPLDAKVGDCISGLDSNLKIVDCTSSDAAYRLTRKANPIGSTCLPTEEFIRIASADLGNGASAFWCAESI
jgi:hypothetical protein